MGSGGGCSRKRGPGFQGGNEWGSMKVAGRGREFGSERVEGGVVGMVSVFLCITNMSPHKMQLGREAIGRSHQKTWKNSA